MNETPEDAPEVVLLYSNDIHSRLEQAAKMASYIADTRRMHGNDRVLAIDIGDHMDRMRLETEGSDGQVNIDLLNEAGYEAVTLGNNEGLTFTLEQLERAYNEQAKFVALCANMRRTESGTRPEWLLPSSIIRKGGIRIGLIGVTAAFSDFYTLLGWDVTDPLEAVQAQVSRLRNRVDVLVVMSHLGLTLDRRMAQEVSGIDLILGGHTHHLLEQPELIGTTRVCAAGKFGEYIGRIEIRLDAVTAKPAYKAACVPVAAYEEQPEASEIIEGYKKTAAQRLARVVTKLEAPLSARSDRESPLCNLLAAGLRRWTGAEIGIVNAGQLLGGLAAGDVTEGEIHSLCPSPINPCSMRLSGQAILQALEQSLLDEYIDKPIRGFGFRGSVLGTLAVDGMSIHWNSDRPALNKIVSLSVNNEPFDINRVYTVGTIDMFTFGVGYETIKSGAEIRYFLPEFIRNVLAEELRNRSALIDCRRSRWISE
ncbi:bifunctional metallophosphatase/5'-nucleotidase [Paenibacillus spongiae]|uniref:Bifunctional metallophosphatase/5'-nucleotidase n=1 Tax=Paenibacillus spongiae TaxID=2909671 RepID=A0ABY5SD55_9BACL|nr:bifunctional UDP-sugar hydrolase/5'-nucleotidase [Paenibacillus spongiae]UVI31861.1 bifunctional metallophosphatase/5'-nucleotidase [Paenibacillus spongiae]